MNLVQHAILGYVVGLGLMWGYALKVYLAGRQPARRNPVE